MDEGGELDFADNAEQAFDAWFSTRGDTSGAGDGDEAGLADLLVKRRARAGVGAEDSRAPRHETKEASALERRLDRAMQRRKRHEIEEKDNVAGTGSGGVPAPGTGSSGEEDEPPSKAARFSTTRRRCGAALTSGHGAAGKEGGKGKGKGKKKGSAERAGVGPAPSAPPFGTESVGVQAAEPTPGGASDGAGGPAETEAERRRRKNRAKKAKKKARKQRAAEEEAARREATFIDAAGGSAVTVCVPARAAGQL